MSKYKDEAEFYKERLEVMEKSLNHWRGRAMDRGEELERMRGKLEVYERLFRKFLKEPTTNDEVFIFRGRVFVPVSYTLSRDPGCVDTLDVTFTETIDMDGGKENQK